MPEQRFFSIKEIAKRFGVSPKTVENWIYASENPMPSLKIGARRLIELSTADEWVEAEAQRQAEAENAA